MATPNTTSKKKYVLRREKKKKRLKILRWVLTCIFIAAAAMAVILFARVYPEYKEYKAQANSLLMDMDADTFRRTGNTYIYDKDDALIGELGNEKYEYVSVTDVSEYVINGYVAREDKTFMEHNGINMKAILRAGIAYIKNNGTITQGGSTITQQVVKNNLLTQDQTFERKILEIMLALQLEKQYSKNQIMEFYVNSCYYGSNCYGIEGAAQYYFGTSADKLTLAQTAMLVASSNSPSTCNPVVDYDGVTAKKNSVLADMLEEGYITQEEYDAAAAETPEVAQQSENVDADNYMISYAIHCAVVEVMEQDGFEFQYLFETADDYVAYEESYNTVYNETLALIRAGGYSIYTSLDTSIQAQLQASVDEGLADFTDTQEDGRYEMQGAAVCIDNSSGLVVAIVGGRGTADSFNRGYQAERQPGSAIKPLLDYGPAINEGVVVPSTVLTDEKTTINGYSPSNAGNSYRGDVTVREALARSLNTIALQLLVKTGRDTCLGYLEQMQFSSLAYADSTVDSISIGGFTNGVTVEDMAKGYAALANGGVYTDATCLRRVDTESGETIYDLSADAEETEVYLDDTAFILTDMMEGVFKETYGTAHAADTDAQAYAGKTGTTNDNKDAWFCGYSAYYTTAVWVGCDTPASVDSLSGASYPLSIWSDFMGKIHEGLEKQEFEIPETVYLVNSSGQTKETGYTSYGSRPDGWDYTSGKLATARVKQEKKEEIEAQIEAAEEAVSEFEDYQITSNEEAAALEGLYYGVLEIIDKVEDAEERAALIDRAAYKYAILADEVVDAWADAQEQIDAAAQEEKDALNAQAAADSLQAAQEAAEAAVSSAKAQNIQAVETYIKYLNSAQYYTDEVEEMISNAQEALEKCTGYSTYNSLKSRLANAISKARALAEEPEDDTITGTVGSDGEEDD
ncbi:MAG: penicillin-binding protein [Clostridiales bacterium]|nr:penicillin-binding protein [Clostridiales bacterium]